MGKSNKPYTVEFKKEAVEILKRSGRSANQIAEELGINQSTLSRWKRELENIDGDSLFALKEELKRLQKENTLLKEERAILEKAAKYFAKESM